MDFLNQNMLWGLLGLSIPVLIHFFNKQNTNRIKWAATSFLEQNQPPKARSFVPKDILLLLLRCLILGLICLVLAIPFFNFISKKQKKEIRFFEETSEIQSQFKFELENEVSEAFFLNTNFNPIQNKRELWRQKSQFTQNEIQGFVNQIYASFGGEDSILVYLRPAKNFYDLPILYLPRNMQIIWGNTKDNFKIPVWKAKNEYFDINGKVAKFENHKQEIVFEKDSLSIYISKKNLAGEKFNLAAIEAIKHIFKYPISIQNAKNKADISIGESINTENDHIQLGAIAAGIQPVSNLNSFMFSPSNVRQSSIRTGTYPEMLLTLLHAHIGLNKDRQTPSLQELKLSEHETKLSLKKNNTPDIRYIWILIIVLIILERFLSIKYSK
jgi:Aerotolerance regulator N-terminal